MIGTTIGIRRFSDSVQINLRCGGDCHVNKLYDCLIDAPKNGRTTMGLQTTLKTVQPTQSLMAKPIGIGRQSGTDPHGHTQMIIRICFGRTASADEADPQNRNIDLDLDVLERVLVDQIEEVQ